jgi:ubiquinone/menaquinone biosynthesis C-methylase UbiE
VDLEAIRARSKVIWSTGDYAPTSRQLEPVSKVLVESLAIDRDHRVLDVAAGHGNCALAAARRGAEVMATDFSPVMIERGRARTAAPGLDVSWREADAAALPFEDGSFDRVTSVFGAIFAPEQPAVAAELARVTAPGGSVGLTAWTADGLIARMLRIPASLGPPPPEGVPDPMAWGDPAHVEGLFAGTGCELTVIPRTVTFTYPSWDDWRRDLEAHGMMVDLKRNTRADAYEHLLAEMRDFLAAHGHADQGPVAYDAEYLEIQARPVG